MHARLIITKLPLVPWELRYLSKSSTTSTLSIWGRRHILLGHFIKKIESFCGISTLFCPKSFFVNKKCIFIGENHPTCMNSGVFDRKHEKA